MSAATRAPNTAASSKELEASRLAPCRPGGGDLADGPKAFHSGAAAHVGGDAAHVIVRGGRDGDEPVDGIDAGGATVGVDGRKGFREMRADGGAAIEESTAPGRDLGEHAAGDDIARRQLGIGMQALHEALAGGVDEDGTFAAQGFGGQWRGIDIGVDGGGMELHELGVGNHGAGAGREGDGLAARVGRIGGDIVKRTDAAGGDDDGARRNEIEQAAAVGVGARQT